MYDLIPQTALASGNSPDQRSAGLLSLITRIEESIEAETVALRANPRFDIKASNARKSRYLHELSMVVRTIREGDLGADHREALVRLRTKLTQNEAALRAHLSAVGEVATLLQDAIRQAQADGTYSVREFGGK
ncbi:MULTISPECIES: hypothetical protein [Chelativorans]|jgi:hypothetical protein|uniref:Flagellar protein FlgN n=1 Tax=Chelativorans sp. (strain BNC1) TaxID=266779 RepID=Q11LQ3_CHESB|nr:MULTISPECIES: hypothetical protein [Chelativorans]